MIGYNILTAPVTMYDEHIFSMIFQLAGTLYAATGYKSSGKYIIYMYGPYANIIYI